VTPAINAMTNDFGSLPGRPGYETNQEILNRYGDGGAADPLVLTVTLPVGMTVDGPGVRDELTEAFQRAARLVGATRVLSYPSTGDRQLVSADGRTTFALIYPPADTAFPPYARSVAALTPALPDIRVAGASVTLTGTDPLFIAASDATGPGLLVEIVIAGVAALVVLALVFGSLVALLPLVMAIIAILVTFLAVWGLTATGDVSFVVQFLVGLVGLGVAIDYTLLITTRWREERTAGATPIEAVERAMATAGSAVVFSGVTVAVALASMVVLPVPFLRAIGVGGLLIPLVSVLVAVTLLPVTLATIGPLLDRHRLRVSLGRRRSGGASDGWTRWARAVVRRPTLTALAAMVVLGALIVPVFSLRLGAPTPASNASSGPARDGLDSLTAAGFGAGVLSPEYVLVTGTNPASVVDRVRLVAGVRTAIAPDDPFWRRDGTSLVIVLVDEPAASYAGQQSRRQVRATADATPGARVGGSSAQGRDFVEAVYGRAPLVLGLALLVTLLLLIRVFQSVLLAVKAVALNVVSVTATFGLIVLAWQQGYLSTAWWGIEATGALTEWVPVMVFAFLFGLSMDYEVFILARMREEYDATGSTSEAAVRGLANTGRLVTSAALILFFAFASLAATPGTEVKIFATALGLGILLDATIVRAMLVPALVVLFGRWNWWLPRWLARGLLIRPSDSRPRTQPR
jgi:RND superfamily putative drug exporter